MSLLQNTSSQQISTQPSVDDLKEILANYKVPHSRFKKTKCIGSGNFGTVYEGLWNNTTSVAIKELKEGQWSFTFTTQHKIKTNTILQGNIMNLVGERRLW